MRTAFMRSRCRSSPRGPRSCLGAGLRALMRGGAYKVRQIWCSRYFLLHSQAWAGSPFRKSIASRQYLGFWTHDIARPPVLEGCLAPTNWNCWVGSFGMQRQR